jgi:hypothetical protein
MSDFSSVLGKLAGKVMNAANSSEELMCLASSMGSPTLYRQVSDGMKVELIEWLNAAKINKKCYYLDKAIKNLIAIRVDFLPVRCLISL